MSKIDIRSKANIGSPILIGAENSRESAVCICLVPGDSAGSQRIVFEVRSMSIGQPGDICLPGGRVDSGESPEDAALREVCEELLVNPEQLELIGEFGMLHTGRRLIHVFMAELSGYEGTFNADEVQETFTVPVEFFAEQIPEEYTTEYRVLENDEFPYDRIVGGKKYDWKDRKDTVYFYQYDRWTIWGLTAKIMNSFSKIIRE